MSTTDSPPFASGPHSPHPLELVAIDLDGTLVDSVADLHAAVVEMQRSLSLDAAPLEAVRHWVGNGVERLVHRALTNAMDEEAPAATFEVALDGFEGAYARLNGHRSTLYPGVVEGLDWLGTLGVPLVCVTNKARRFSVPLLDALGIAGRFADHVAGDDVSRKKPDPAALLLAAERTGARPARAVLIGDSISDTGAARAAGFASIGVSYGYNHGRTMHELEDGLRPDVVIDSFSELPAAFERLAGRLPRHP